MDAPTHIEMTGFSSVGFVSPKMRRVALGRGAKKFRQTMRKQWNYNGYL